MVTRITAADALHPRRFETPAGSEGSSAAVFDRSPVLPSSGSSMGNTWAFCLSSRVRKKGVLPEAASQTGTTSADLD